MTAKTVDEVIKFALSFDGMVEKPLGSNYIIFNDWFYGKRQAGAWCDTFQSYIDWHCGVPVGPGPKGSAYTPSHAQWFKNIGRWGTTPKLGAVPFFDFPNDGVNRISHVARIIKPPTNSGIYCIEGNTDEKGGRTGGKVMQKFRAYGSYIIGYGYPQYGTGTTPQEDDMFETKDRARLDVAADQIANIEKAVNERLNSTLQTVLDAIKQVDVRVSNLESSAGSGGTVDADAIADKLAERLRT